MFYLSASLLPKCFTTEAHSRPLYLFYCKECNNLTTHLAEFSNLTLFSKGIKVVSVVFCSLIKNAKINQSQSLLDLFM